MSHSLPIHYLSTPYLISIMLPSFLPFLVSFCCLLSCHFPTLPLCLSSSPSVFLPLPSFPSLWHPSYPFFSLSVNYKTISFLIQDRPYLDQGAPRPSAKVGGGGSLYSSILAAGVGKFLDVISTEEAASLVKGLTCGGGGGKRGLLLL